MTPCRRAVAALPTIARSMSLTSPGPANAAVSFRSVSKRYGGSRGSVQALDGVSFDIEPGEFFGLLGPNGAGKTTLISAELGISPGNLYYHYPAKDELINSLFEDRKSVV